jgi:hypothetical protein
MGQYVRELVAAPQLDEQRGWGGRIGFLYRFLPVISARSQGRKEKFIY